MYRRRRYTPDLDLVSLSCPGATAADFAAGAGPVGFLVCRVGPRVEGVREGDVITAVDGVPVAVDRAAAASLAAAAAEARRRAAEGYADDPDEEEGEEEDGGLVGRDGFVTSLLGQRLGPDAAGALFDRVDLDRAGLVGLGELRAKADAELAQRLFGPYKSAARLALLRPERPGGAYREVAGGADVARTRDARERAAPQALSARACCVCRCMALMALLPERSRSHSFGFQKV